MPSMRPHDVIIRAKQAWLPMIFTQLWQTDQQTDRQRDLHEETLGYV